MALAVAKIFFVVCVVSKLVRIVFIVGIFLRER